MKATWNVLMSGKAKAGSEESRASTTQSTGFTSGNSQASNMQSIGSNHAFMPFTGPYIPPELQFKIVRFCVTTKTPFIDYGYSNPHYFRLKEKERHGQDDVHLEIMFCSKAHFYEGFKHFWHDNIFLYSGKYPENFCATPPPVDENSPEYRWQIIRPRRPWFDLLLDEPLGRPANWALKSDFFYKRPGFIFLHHLILRHDTSRYPPHQMTSVIDTLRIAVDCPALKTLSLQLIPRGVVEPIPPRRPMFPYPRYEAWFNQVRRQVHEVINGDSSFETHNKKYNAARPTRKGKLVELHLQGFPFDNVSLMCILCASVFLGWQDWRGILGRGSTLGRCA